MLAAHDIRPFKESVFFIYWQGSYFSIVNAFALILAL